MWQLCPWAGAAAEKRGYNQAELLARRVAGALHIPYADLLEKVRNNPAQRKQNARSRRVNVYGAYAVIDDSALWDKTVLLIDDVKTTGATLNECAKMLRMHGARRYMRQRWLLRSPDHAQKAQLTVQSGGRYDLH